MSKKNSDKNKNTKKKKVKIKNKKIVNSNKKINRLEIRKREKIWLWLILFAPYGIYKAIKYKAFNKYVGIGMAILLSLIGILTFDSMYYPDRVLDNKMKETINSIEELGSFRAGEKIGAYKEDFIIYNIITSKGEFDLYIKGYNKEDIIAINEISPDRKFVYTSEDFSKNLKDVFPEIIRFFNEEESETKFGKIEKVLETHDNSQKIKTSKGTYVFNVNYEQIESIFVVNEKGEQSKVLGKKPIIKLPKEIEKVLKKREDTLGEMADVISYKLTPTSREYIILMHNGNYHKIVLEDDKTITIYNEN